MLHHWDAAVSNAARPENGDRGVKEVTHGVRGPSPGIGAGGGWSKTEAAQQLGISQGSVSDFTSGKRVPSTKGIESIAYRLGTPAEVFTSKVIPLDQMRKLLAGNRSSRIAESSTPYRTSQPDL